MSHSQGFFRGSVKTPYYSIQNTRDTKRNSNNLGERLRSQDYLREAVK